MMNMLLEKNKTRDFRLPARSR